MLLSVLLIAHLAVLALACFFRELSPSPRVAEQRGPEIFNAIHNAMRQWGSSLHHNGMSFFLVTIPEDVMLYHGNKSPQTPLCPDWLAFEIEHAENFAPSPSPPHDRDPHSDTAAGGSQNIMVQDGDHAVPSGQEDEVRGYLHVYKTTRPLRFLYADGMSGAKTSMGTLDTQDFLLRGMTIPEYEGLLDGELPNPDGSFRQQPSGPLDESQRATDLCALCKEWGLQGVIRMEAGFEIIKCDFSEGLEEVQALSRPVQHMNDRVARNFEFMRGLSERYDGIGSSRAIVDFSSMVSALFFPVNLTNPDDRRPDLPRIISIGQSQLAQIRHYLTWMIEERLKIPCSRTRTIDWQGVSDLIVSRYADRLLVLAENTDSVEVLSTVINFLLDMFVDGSGVEDQEIPVARCADHYLRSVRPVTEADELIYRAFKVVTHGICSTLFRVRSMVSANPSIPAAQTLASARGELAELVRILNWARFRRCPTCAMGEVCLIPMWPMGSTEDYYHPKCTTGARNTADVENYWDMRPEGCCYWGQDF
ncbi:hypothetical protein BX600DRAFT_483050 [Xylariales sp. PMI_506]|nr:hypothetical protein BX600DRAFT_483050 [Xylariales sp. PMI_506]